ncbi:MAG: A24 family peptidase [Armatimonadota bacterium]|nr:A24 family peptidase [Armatimonadota bacterium]MCX7777691.1 A24 family peptidase [Armatimonadota bacterium]MDW8025450.1 A24 family peptidase [Armatimonadota bacterium]
MPSNPELMKLLVRDLLTLLFIAAACYTDCRYSKVPNKLTFPSMAVGIVTNLLLDGKIGLANSLIGLLVGLGVFFVPFAIGWFKGGDVKFCMAVGALKGSELMFWESYPFWAFLYGAAIGGIVSAVVLIRRRLGLKPFVRLMSYLHLRYVAGVPVEYEHEDETRFPYVLNLALGCILAMVLEASFGHANPLFKAR